MADLSSAGFVGRDTELGLVNGVVDRSRHRGAMVVRGVAGVGKSALLAECGKRAASGGMLVLRASGVESEAKLTFAGLHQLLRPLLGDVRQLPEPQRDALLVAFGMAAGEAPDLFLIALATLELLGDSAARRPIVLIADDAHWLDRSTQEVLAFAARRLDVDPIALLVAVRDGTGSALEGVGLPELELGPLDEVASGKLLDAAAPGLPAGLRERLLREAAGNPLALVELPLTASQLPVARLANGELSLTSRLEQAFVSRVRRLPADTQTLLLVAALNDGEALSETLAAASIVADTEITVDELLPAASVGLVESDGWGMRFRHGLVRAAITQSAAAPRRRAAHAALGDVLMSDPDRCVWHRAAANSRPDQSMALELEAAAGRALSRAGLGVAAGALERAAQFSENPASRGSLLLRAAELSFEIGRLDLVHRILLQADTLELPAVQRALRSWLTKLYDLRQSLDPGPLGSLVEIAEQLRSGGDVERAMNALHTIAQLLWLGASDEATRQHLIAVAEDMPVPPEDPTLLSILAYAAPLDRGPVILDRLATIAHRGVRDAVGAYQAGAAALMVGAVAEATDFIDESIASLRAQGRLALLTDALQTQAYHGIWLGRWDLSYTAADETIRFAQEVGNPVGVAAAQISQAMLAAVRGDAAAVEALTEAAERIFIPIGVKSMLAFAQAARGALALSQGSHEIAYEHLERVFDPTDVVHDVSVQQWVIADLVEAAVHSGHAHQARAEVRRLELLATRSNSPLLLAGLMCARPALACGSEAENLFNVALGGQLTGLPFFLARLRLAYGTWLRRQRRTVESRAPLRAAREAFDGLGAVPWGERARQELRASGETSRKRVPEARDQLSPQELQIAKMAAEGLTNREIAQKLFVSNRTVGSHLYRIFPKLGVTSRSQLGDALRADRIAPP